MTHSNPYITWIPVEKELPSKEDLKNYDGNVPCLVTVYVPDTLEMGLAYFKSDGKFYDAETGDLIDCPETGNGVIAWTLIPYPYMFHKWER